MREEANWVWRLAAKAMGRPEGFLAGTFAGLICAGTILLALPVSQQGDRVRFLDALFLSTSAVCVTGLSTVDMGTDFTRFGQVVITVLMQLGGLGIMIFAALGAQAVGRRLSFRSQAALSDAFFQSPAASQLRTDLKRIILLTFGCEALGAVLLYMEFARSPHAHPLAFSAAFHAISAFCNCGLCLFPDSLTAYSRQPLVLCTFMFLIILGGLGHAVVLEVARRAKRSFLSQELDSVRFSLHSRVVLWTTVCLIIVGTLGILLCGQTEVERSWGERVWGALFQSVTSRTAGFNTVNISKLPAASLLVLIILMFIGGAPASCAGGIKTTSFAVWIAHFRARLKGAKDTVLFNRRIPEDTVARVALVSTLAVAWSLLGMLVLTLTERPGAGEVSFLDLLFEQISAFGTVGLSTGATAGLSVGGKVWIIMTMFIGRVGPLTAAMAIIASQTPAVRHPQERVMIG